ncbi:MAG: type I-MYXAN CRISPR-associated Cas8a1/Cmx1 [Acidobacteriota bacterium]
MNQTLKLQMNEPGLSSLHRAGLAGLWMTLDALIRDVEDDKIDWPDWIEYPPKLDAHGIEINWEGTPQRLLDWLLPEAFGIDTQGDKSQMIEFAGLRPAKPSPEAKSVIHQSVLGTFLQHGKTRKTIKGQYQHTFIVDEIPVLLNYAKLEEYSHQKAASDFCDKDEWAKSVKLAGWLAPGGVVRHTAFTSDTALEESPQRALLLLFAPVGCFYFNLRSTIHAQKARFAIVIPEINSLETYASIRRNLRSATLLDLTACGTGDAAFRLISTAREQLRTLECKQCKVITLGTVPWSTQQKTRTAAITVDLSSEDKLQIYDLIKHSLPNRVVQSKSKKGEEASGFIVPSIALELFADNLALGRKWYTNFTSLMQNKETYKLVKFEKEGLNKVVKNVNLELPEKVIVEACHEALRYRYGQISSRAKRERADLKSLFEREYEKLRVGLARCKSSSALRKELTDFWSRAGQLKTLQENWSAVIPMFTEQNWSRARDLALLALASYKRPETQTESSDNQGGEQT